MKSLLRSLVGLCFVALAIKSLGAAPIILNEYNAVSSSRYLDGNDYNDAKDKADPFFASIPNMPDGRIQGNGGNWFELVVVEDHVDARGWQIQWAEQGSNTGTGDIWTGDGSVDQGILTLSNDNVWSDLRSGTIITFSELEQVLVDTTEKGQDRNFTLADDADGTFEVTIDLSTDTSFDPASGDWWIHISTLDELDSPNPLVTTKTNVQDDKDGNFSVGNDDWQLSIVDTNAETKFGPAGEGLGSLSGGLNSREVGKLEENPASTINADSDYNDGTSSTLGAPNVFSGGTMTQDFSGIRNLAPAVMLQAGDADQNLEFDQLDLVKVQIAAKYLTGADATWGDGDWDGAPGGSAGSPPAGNGKFDQGDIVAALQAGVYLTGPYSALGSDGTEGDSQTSLVYDPGSGELSVDAPAGKELTSINISSAGSLFTGDKPAVLDGAFDNFAADNVFKATFGGSFGSISFGNVLPADLSKEAVTADLSAVGSLAGGGDLGEVDLIYVPEPSAMLMLGLTFVSCVVMIRRNIRAA